MRHLLLVAADRVFAFRFRKARPCDNKGKGSSMASTADAHEETSPADTTPDTVGPTAGDAGRIASLDFIRGLAVMGILAANIVAFGQPFAAYMYPDAFMTPHGSAEETMWIAQFVLIDGKMRALFTLLFGVGLYIFMERAWAKGATRWLQVRRLLWLGLFGLLHYFFIWNGDILFLYAVAGLCMMPFIKMTARGQLILGLITYVAGGLLYLGIGWSMEMAESGAFATSEQEAAEMQAEMEKGKQEKLTDSREDAQAIIAGDYAGFVAHNFRDNATDLLFLLIMFWMETWPLMLIGMALYRMGLFEGRFARGKQAGWALAGLAVGGVLSLLIALRVQAMDFSYYSALAAFIGWSHFPRLMMGLGLLALLALVGAGILGWLGERISAAGRAAFTNYLGTSVLMLFVFHGWGLGLFGDLTRGQLYLVVLGTCALMLLWSKPWLERFRFGPLEWLWRCLTYGRAFPLRR